MDKLSGLRAFVQVVEAGGFAAAARAMGQSRSAVNRLVINLEADLGVQLLNRTTRRVVPTATGQAFYRRSKQIIVDLAEAEQAASRTREAPFGPLRINAPMSFGTLHLASAIPEFMQRYRDVQVHLTLDDRLVDLVQEGYDLAIRIAEPNRDPALVDHRILGAERVICAAPAYLAQHGTPKHPSELRNRPCLHYGNLVSGTFWRFEGPDGPAGVHVDGVLCSNNGEVLREAAIAGLGVALLPRFIAGKALRRGSLATILDDYRAPQIGIYVLYPVSRHLSAKVRLFADFLIERFSDLSCWEAC